MRQLRSAALAALAALVVLALVALVEPPNVHSQPKKDVHREKLTKLMMATYKEQAKSFFKARKQAEKWLAYARKHRGRAHADTVNAMNALATIYSFTGARAKAEKLQLEAVSIAEAKDGPNSVTAARALDTLGYTYWAQQRLDEAEKIFVKTLRIYRKEHGAKSETFAMYLGRQAGFLQGRYLFAAAEALFIDQQRIYAKKDPYSVQALQVQLSLGMLHGRQGDIKGAKKAFDKMLAGYAKSKSTSVEVNLIAAQQSVASMYAMWGKHTWSKALWRKVETGWQRELDKMLANPNMPVSATVGYKYSLAMAKQKLGKLDEATKLFEGMQADLVKQHGKNSFQASTYLYALSEIYQIKGETKKARRALTRWAKIYEKAFGGFTGVSPVMHLAELERKAGNFKKMRRLAKRVQKAAAKAYGANHPTTGLYSQSIATAELGLGHPKAALKLLQKSYATEKKAIALMLASGTENDNRTYLNERRHHLHFAVSLHSQYLKNNKAAIRLGLDTVLVHKGRLLDASASSVASLRQRLSKKDRVLLDELAAARSELANLVIAGPKAMGGDEEQYVKEIARLERLVRKLEGKVRSRSAVFRAREQPIEIKKIQKAIPKGASLVEIVIYRRVEPGGAQVVPPGGDRYGAYVLARSGDPSFVDLGSIKRIDVAVDRLRRELSTASGSDYEKYGKQLYNLIFAKLEPLLAKRKFVLMSPDGALNLLPFAALVDKNDKFLIERYTFSYLTSGRDLLRLAVKINSKSGAVIFADPSFDNGGKKAPKGKSRGLTARALRSVTWKRLPGTALEAKALVKLIDDASLFDGTKATESTLKKVSAPRILHLATHGFFLPSESAPPAEQPKDPNVTSSYSMMATAPSLGSGQDNPLLRSGLALAGANKLLSGTEDGVLTALEASNLDLWGTKLVVLSACETGVGKVTQGEGVYGLRRALVMAGAESMLMSLWQVDDAATKDLMVGYYTNLGRGKGRADSLRRIQLKMLKSEAHDHPYFWASFIPSGAWTAMK